MKPIHEMTTEEKNREVAEWLGLPWKDVYWCERCGYANVEGGPPFCFCDPPVKITKRGRRNNPDFTTDAGKIQLLREMEKRLTPDAFEDFITECCDGDNAMAKYSDGHYESYNMIRVDLLTDTTGKLLDAILKWKRRNEKLRSRN